MVISCGRMRSSHLHFHRKLKQLLAVRKHPVDFVLRYTMIDQVCEANISAGGIETLADLGGGLSSAEVDI